MHFKSRSTLPNRRQLSQAWICPNVNQSLLLLLISCMISIANSVFDKQIQKDCKELNANLQCQCLSVGEDFEIQCPYNKPEPKIKVLIRPGFHMQMTCDHIDASEYKLLPNMSIGHSPRVFIKRCPLPDNTPISSILEKLGVMQLSSLEFESSDLNASLTRQHLSGLQGLGHLHFSSNGLSQIHDDLFSDLRNLTSLDLSSINIELSTNIFASLENLDFLGLGQNNLQHLPAGIFRKQRKLKSLNLWNNQLRNLSKAVFEGAVSVTDLDLMANSIENFQPDVFEMLKNLSNINLSANHFRELPVGLFNNNKNLSHFYLTNNRGSLTTLPQQLFANLPYLKYVIITCGLETIPGNLFTNSSSIGNITLASNDLAELPVTLFADQKNLVNLDMSRNRLRTLPDELFLNTRRLIVLKLSHNLLEEVTSELFAPLSNLEQLYMVDNRLTTIHPGAFTYTKSIRYINMGYNQIKIDNDYGFKVNSPFKYLKNLRELNLSNNFIEEIFYDWQVDLEELQKIDLSYNKITSLDFSDFQFLNKHNISLNLTHNLIHTVNFKKIHQLLDNSRDVHMHLNDNPMSCDCNLLPFVQFVSSKISSGIRRQIKLDTEHLTCQEPGSLHGMLVRDVNPKLLVCSKQKLCPSGCECLWRSVDMTLMVNCTNFNLTSLPYLKSLDLIEEERNSTELYVENNKLIELPSATTPGYANVTQIHAAGNHLSYLESSNLPPGLTHLDISNNKFVSINNSVLNFLNHSHVQSVKFSGNDWACDCKNKLLFQFAFVNYKLISDHKNLHCVDPMNPLKKTRFQDILLTELCPVDRTLVIALAVVIALIGFLIGISAGLYYKYEVEIKVWLYAHDLCLWLVSEEELDKDKKYDAFISYSHKDEQFIEDFLVPELENGPIPFKLCVHVRDFIPGEYIADQIVRSVDNSRRTIVLLSQNFIESMWSRLEFREAHMAAINEGRSRVIVIIYGDIGDIDSLDIDLKAYLKTNTYLKWGDPWFWSKLRYAMPHKCNESMDVVIEFTELTQTSKTAETTHNAFVTYSNGHNISQATLPNGETASDKLRANGYINGGFNLNIYSKQSHVYELEKRIQNHFDNDLLVLKKVEN